VTVPLADVNFSTDGDVVIASVRGEIDMSNVGEIGDAIGRQLSNAALALVLDLTACEYLDSAGIHQIYELQERLRTRGQGIRVVIAPGAMIAETLRLADVPRAIGATETVEAALTSLRST
jgi:anti-sigma B factor antagonist